MSDLQNITCDEISTKLLIILHINKNKTFDQYTLFNEVVNKFRTTQSTNYISPEFKSKFLLVLRSLMSRNDDITITKKNNVYYAGYEMINTNIEYNINYSDHWLEKDTFNNYIIENNLEDELDYVDPENGNTIFHDILSSNNYTFIEKVVKTFHIDYNLKSIQIRFRTPLPLTAQVPASPPPIDPAVIKKIPPIDPNMTTAQMLDQ
jgi:hypothetical protein